ncbi:DUF1772 domain-containing protein, partial [Streptosporangium sp. NPDC000563]|uniref:DUF1772 domain-containing protein n=1 Tax=Streptosporangium sp. NPDC000563 TaxID=3154366 RepID=UPI00331D62D3
DAPHGHGPDVVGKPRDRFGGTRFEAAWVRWNLVRTLACVAAFGCLTWALVVYGRTGLPNGS